MSTSPHSASLRGREAEDLAYRYLQDHGLQLLQRNYHCRCGEIDLVMKDADTTVFVEVRYRRHDRFGSAAETVDRRKQKRLSASALHYLQRHKKASKRPARIDVIAITATSSNQAIQWIQNAIVLSDT